MGMFFDRVINVKRLSADSDNSNKESYQSYVPLQNVAINIQPGSSEDAIIAGGAFGQTYIGFTTASGILEGDHLTVQVTGETYVVKGKSNWMSPDMGASHIELLLIEFETTE